jgi:hypothetical protein
MPFNNCSGYYFDGCANKTSKQAEKINAFLAFEICR